VSAWPKRLGKGSRGSRVEVTKWTISLKEGGEYRNRCRDMDVMTKAQSMSALIPSLSSRTGDIQMCLIVIPS
jgi:hypothetical protein